MKRVASATERDMVGWRSSGVIERCRGPLLLRDVSDVNVNVERFLARRNWKSVRDDEVDFFSTSLFEQRAY